MHSTGTSPENLAQPGQVNSSPQSSRGRVLAALCNPWLSGCLILIVCFALFGRTLGSYFLADDIGEVRYVHHIFAGHWDLFWSNFCGNYMQVPNMSVYRPVLLLTLVVDYLFWRGNPFGYYLSNLFYFSASAVLLCMFIRQLCAAWGHERSALAGLVTACLFATNPLHCESISWVVGRVDSACCMFYLAALCVFMSGKTLTSVWMRVLGVVFFVLSICTKEMAVGLAPVLAALGFMFADELSWPPSSTCTGANGETHKYSDACGGWRQGLLRRLKFAWRLSCPIWIATAIYFLFRFWALGTILGGYSGSVGAGQTASALGHWLDWDSWHRLLVPIPYDLFVSNRAPEQVLVASYFGLGFLVFLRLLAGSLPWRYLAFLIFWGLTLAAPIYRLFGLGANLEGGRFCFFLSLALASLLPLMILAPDKNAVPRPLALKLSCLGLILIGFAAFTSARCAYATNLLWLHAGKEVRAVRDDAIRLSKNCPPGEKDILLGVPREHSGAHLILNGLTLQMLMAPPFTDKEYSQPFLVFEPVLFGNSPTNGARLRSLVNKPGIRGPFVWSHTENRFVQIPLDSPPGTPSESRALQISFSSKDGAPPQASPCTFGHGDYAYADNTLRVSHPTEGDGVRLNSLQVNPLSCSYLKVSFKSSNNNITLPFQVRWQADAGSKRLSEMESLNVVEEKLRPDASASSGTVRTVYIPLGRNWRWYAQAKATDLRLFFPAVEEISLVELALLPAEFVNPIISTPGQADNCGVIEFNPGDKFQLESKLGSEMLVQLSRRQFFFDNLSGDEERSCIAAEFKFKGNKGVLTIPTNSFEGGGYYQLRACSLDENGRIVGDYSDTVTLLK